MTGFLFDVPIVFFISVGFFCLALRNVSKVVGWFIRRPPFAPLYVSPFVFPMYMYNPDNSSMTVSFNIWKIENVVDCVIYILDCNYRENVFFQVWDVNFNFNVKFFIFFFIRHLEWFVEWRRFVFAGVRRYVAHAAQAAVVFESTSGRGRRLSPSRACRLHLCTHFVLLRCLFLVLWKRS